MIINLAGEPIQYKTIQDLAGVIDGRTLDKGDIDSIISAVRFVFEQKPLDEFDFSTTEQGGDNDIEPLIQALSPHCERVGMNREVINMILRSTVEIKKAAAGTHVEEASLV